MPGRRGRAKTRVQNNLLPIPVGLGQITAVAPQWRFFRCEIFLTPLRAMHLQAVGPFERPARSCPLDLPATAVRLRSIITRRIRRLTRSPNKAIPPNKAGSDKRRTHQGPPMRKLIIRIIPPRQKCPNRYRHWFQQRDQGRLITLHLSNRPGKDHVRNRQLNCSQTEQGDPLPPVGKWSLANDQWGQAHHTHQMVHQSQPGHIHTTQPSQGNHDDRVHQP